MSSTTAADTLSPSEQLLLAAAASGSAPSTTAPLQQPSDAVVHEAVAAAFLANEQAGHLTLEPGTRKRLFGLLSSKALFARPTGAATASWPAGTLEARVLAAAVATAARGEPHVGAVIESFVDWDEGPESETRKDAWRALRDRGLLRQATEQKKTLGVFTTTVEHDLLTAEGAALLAAPPAGRRLVDEARTRRPELWSLLWKATTGTYAARTRSSSSSDSSSDYSSSSD